MFEPVTITRSASVAGGAGAAPGGGGSGGFCANAFDAMMRGIPTQAARVMRRNPNLDGPGLVIVSPLVRLALTATGLRKISQAGKTIFHFFEILLNVPLTRVSQPKKSLRKTTIAGQA